MRTPLCLLISACLASCAMSPGRAARATLPMLCYYTTAGQPDERQAAQAELAKRGNYSCTQSDMQEGYQWAARERGAGADIAAGVGAYGAGRYGTPPTPPRPTSPGGAGYYVGESTQGDSRFCRYNRLGSLVVVTVNAALPCPTNIQ